MIEDSAPDGAEIQKQQNLRPGWLKKAGLAMVGLIAAGSSYAVVSHGHDSSQEAPSGHEYTMTPEDIARTTTTMAEITTTTEAPTTTVAPHNKVPLRTTTSIRPEQQTNRLTPFSELSGRSVSPEKINQLKRSVLILNRRPKDSVDSWQPFCNITKASVSGKTTLVGAGHCFDELRNYYDASMNGTPVDISKESSYEFMVSTPENPNELIAELDGISISRKAGIDLAVATTKNETATFETIPTHTYATSTLQQGDRVAIRTANRASYYAAAEEDGGVYIGEYTDGPFKLTVVALPGNYENWNNPYEFGSSGGGTAVGGDGNFLGPIIFTINRKGSDPSRNNSPYITKIQEQLHIDLSNVQSIGEHLSITPQQIQDVAAGIGHFS